VFLYCMVMAITVVVFRELTKLVVMNEFVLLLFIPVTRVWYRCVFV